MVVWPDDLANGKPLFPTPPGSRCAGGARPRRAMNAVVRDAGRCSGRCSSRASLSGARCTRMVALGLRADLRRHAGHQHRARPAADAGRLRHVLPHSQAGHESVLTVPGRRCRRCSWSVSCSQRTLVFRVVEGARALLAPAHLRHLDRAREPGPARVHLRTCAPSSTSPAPGSIGGLSRSPSRASIAFLFAAAVTALRLPRSCRRTRLGRLIRATSQSREVAMVCGINVAAHPPADLRPGQRAGRRRRRAAGGDRGHPAGDGRDLDVQVVPGDRAGRGRQLSRRARSAGCCSGWSSSSPRCSSPRSSPRSVAYVLLVLVLLVRPDRPPGRPLDVTRRTAPCDRARRRGGRARRLPRVRRPATASARRLQIFMWIALAGSWNLISGLTGYVSFGHVAFFGIGRLRGGDPDRRPTAGRGRSPRSAAGSPRACWRWSSAVRACGSRGPTSPSPCSGSTRCCAPLVSYFEGLTGGGSGLSLPTLDASVPIYYVMGAGRRSPSPRCTYLIITSRFGLRLMTIREDEIAAEADGDRHLPPQAGRLPPLGAGPGHRRRAHRARPGLHRADQRVSAGHHRDDDRDGALRRQGHGVGAGARRRRRCS